MPNLMQMLVNRFLSGQMSQMPQMQQVMQMLQGKNQQQQWETLCNFARSRGIDPEKTIILSPADAKALGLNGSPKQG